MGIYEVVIDGMINNQQRTVNRFNYVSSGTPAAVSGSYALTSALGFIYEGPPVGAYPSGTLQSAWVNMVTNHFVFTRISVKNVHDSKDFYKTPILPTLTGDISNEGLPTFNTYGFISSQVDLAIKAGQKRIAGVSENNQANGVITSAFVDGAMATFAERLGATLNYVDEGQGMDFRPIICSLQKTAYVENGVTKYRREYYATEAEQMAHSAVGIIWSPYNTVRSQMSRQRGRGV